ncbi:hypothetical protein BGZ94_000543, partial [Podila epigama]
MASAVPASTAVMHRKKSTTSRSSIDAGGSHIAHRRQSHTIGVPLANVDPALEGVVKHFMNSEKFLRRVKPIVKMTHVPGRQNYKFAPATGLTPQETKTWRTQLIQDEITSNNPFWAARWMCVFGVAPKLDESLLKVPWIKCERSEQTAGDEKAGLPLHRRETYLDLRDDQNRQWAKESYDLGIMYAQNNQIDDAVKAYTQAVQIDNKYIDAYIARGCVLVNIAKYRQAVMDFRQALVLDPSNPLAQQFLESACFQEEQSRLLEGTVGINDASENTAVNPKNAPESKLSNIDNIHELVLDSDLMDTHEVNDNKKASGANQGGSGNNEKKKKKKNNKKQSRPEDWDMYDRIDRERGRDRARDRGRDRARDGKERDASNNNRRKKEADRYVGKGRRGSRSRSARSIEIQVKVPITAKIAFEVEVEVSFSTAAPSAQITIPIQSAFQVKDTIKIKIEARSRSPAASGTTSLKPREKDNALSRHDDKKETISKDNDTIQTESQEKNDTLSKHDDKKEAVSKDKDIIQSKVQEKDGQDNKKEAMPKDDGKLQSKPLEKEDQDGKKEEMPKENDKVQSKSSSRPRSTSRARSRSRSRSKDRVSRVSRPSRNRSASPSPRHRNCNRSRGRSPGRSHDRSRSRGRSRSR